MSNLKRNLSGVKNSHLINLNGFTDRISDDFATALEKLIKGWVSQGYYTISLTDNSQYVVNFSAYQWDGSKATQKDVSDRLLSYVNQTINSQITNGNLVVDQYKKTISFTAKKPGEKQQTTKKPTDPYSYESYKQTLIPKVDDQYSYESYKEKLKPNTTDEYSVDAYKTKLVPKTNDQYSYSSYASKLKPNTTDEYSVDAYKKKLQTEIEQLSPTYLNLLEEIERIKQLLK